MTFTQIIVKCQSADYFSQRHSGLSELIRNDFMAQAFAHFHLSRASIKPY